jgi:serine/threonine-protein kinase
MRVGVSGAFPVPVDRLAHECVFLVEPETPHYEFRGLATLAGLTPLRLQGASNAYVTDVSLSDPVLRLTSSDEQLEVTLMDDLLTAPPAWAMDKSPRWNVQWQQFPRSDVPFSQRIPADYRQRDESPLGFDEKALPTLPESGETEGDSPRSAANASGNREEF